MTHRRNDDLKACAAALFWEVEAVGGREGEAANRKRRLAGSRVRIDKHWRTSNEHEP